MPLCFLGEFLNFTSNLHPSSFIPLRNKFRDGERLGGITEARRWVVERFLDFGATRLRSK